VWSVRLNAGNLIDGYPLASQYVQDDKDPKAKEQGGWRYRRPDEYRGYHAPETPAGGSKLEGSKQTTKA
jgi:hypothetical protein